MKVKFLKDHLRHRKGEEADIVDAQANYYIKCGVAEEVKQNAEEPKLNEPLKTTAPKKKRGK